MGKIPLFVGKSLGFDRDMVAFSVRYGSLPNFFARGMVDTGCPFVVISESTIKKTRINYCDKPIKYNVQVGQILLELRELGECEICFRDENNNPIKFKHNIFVGTPTVRGFLSQEIPSFIGKDFLNKYSLSIINKKEGNYLSFED